MSVWSYIFIFPYISEVVVLKVELKGEELFDD